MFLGSRTFHHTSEPGVVGPGAAVVTTSASVVPSDSLSIKIKDNGKGFDPEQVKSGLGLKNIELRVMSLGASYKFKPAKPQGCNFILAVKQK